MNFYLDHVFVELDATGKDVQKLTGLRGAEVGRILERVFIKKIDGVIKNKRQELHEIKGMMSLGKR